MFSYVDTINMFSGIFTGVGTVGAVIISLWLSYQKAKIRAKSEISFSTIYLPSTTDQEKYLAEEVVAITVTNLNVKSFRVNVFGGYDKKTNKHFMIMPHYQNPYGTPSSHLYSEADTGTYFFPLQGFISSAKNFIESDGEIDVKRLKKIRFTVATNMGTDIQVFAKIEFYKTFLDKLK